jgi:hypothetical protein
VQRRALCRASPWLSKTCNDNDHIAIHHRHKTSQSPLNCVSTSLDNVELPIEMDNLCREHSSILCRGVTCFLHREPMGVTANKTPPCISMYQCDTFFDAFVHSRCGYWCESVCLQQCNTFTGYKEASSGGLWKHGLSKHRSPRLVF